MSANTAKARAEDIWLSAESLERQLLASHADDGAMLSAVNEVVIAARELYSALAAASTTPEGEKP